KGARVLKEISADAGSGELQPGPGHGPAQEGGDPPVRIVDRRLRIDNDGGGLANGPPVFQQDEGVEQKTKSQLAGCPAISNAGGHCRCGRPGRRWLLVEQASTG